MKMTIETGGSFYSVNLDAPLDIAIAIDFSEDQLAAFGAPPAKRDVYSAGDFTGDVKKGGSCNCATYTITPHCNGTHTESIGHIAANDIFICDVLEDGLVPATLVSVTPDMRADESVITKNLLEAELSQIDDDFIEALVLRTLPNGPEKITRNYDTALPPYLDEDAMAYIAARGVKHLLVDVPSVDKMDDGGALAAHRVFWGVKAGETDLKPSPKTITELVFVPEAIKDGVYVLNLQVAAFKADAAPSRPVLYEVESL